MSDEKQNTPRLSGILILVILFGAILLIGDLTRRMGEARRLEQDLVILQTEVVELALKNAALATQVAEATSEASIRSWAHSDARMIEPGERLVVPIAPEGAVQLPAATPTPHAPPPSNLDVWLALLFGG